MTDIIHKIIYIDDIFKYIIDFLNFDDKIIFSKVINKNLVKNIDIFNKKYMKKDLSEYFYICTECYNNLSDNIYHNLIHKYNNFLSDSEFEHIYDNCYYITVKAFLEILDKNNIKLDIIDYECIFHLELNDKIYDKIYDRIENIYENAILNDLLEVFCKKCGNFGHCPLYEYCILYNKSYKEKEVRYDVKNIIDDIIKNVFNVIKKDKIMNKKKNNICKSCNLYLLNKKCTNKYCKKCCDCKFHKLL
jgi:hypothetical protein